MEITPSLTHARSSNIQLFETDFNNKNVRIAPNTKCLTYANADALNNARMMVTGPLYISLREQEGGAPTWSHRISLTLLCQFFYASFKRLI